MQRIYLLKNHLNADEEEKLGLNFRCDYGLGLIEIDRASRMNTFTMEMAQEFLKNIITWNQKDDVKFVILKKKEGKAFCAGGDLSQTIRTQFNYGIAINTLVYNLSIMRPNLISIMDGVVMGTGVGISFFGKIKIVTEKTIWAMPESKLGYITDVGSGWYLARLKNGYGNFLAFTGNQVRGKDLVKLGLANFFVESHQIVKLENDIHELLKKNPQSNLEEMKSLVSKYSVKVEGKFDLDEIIKEHFTLNSPEEILQSLRRKAREGTEEKKILDIINSNCPMSIVLNFEMQKLSLNMTFKEYMILELNSGEKLLKRSDVREGALGFLKKVPPKWNPDKLEKISRDNINELLSISRDFDLDKLK